MRFTEKLAATNPEQLVELREAIVELRKHLGLTQEQLATRLGIKHATIWRWEHGRTVPQPSMLREFLLMAPAHLRHIFEDLTDLTLEQASIDRSNEGASRTRKTEARWSNDPAKYLDEIHLALQDRIRDYYLRAKNGDEKAVKSIAKMFWVSS